MAFELFSERYYDETAILLNDLQKDVYGKLLGLNEEQSLTFIKDMGVFPKKHQEDLYTWIENDEIKAVMKLKFNEQKDKETGSLKLKKAIKSYGFWKLFRLFIIASKYLDETIEDESLYLDYIIVKKRYRHQKIGSKMLKEAEKIALSIGKKNITLNVFDSNLNAISAYKKHGFIVMKRNKLSRYARKKWETDAILKMRKKIS